MFDVSFDADKRVLRCHKFTVWRDVCTAHFYNQSVLSWLDEAKDLLFTFGGPGTNPFFLGELENDWVIRRHECYLLVGHEYHKQFSYRNLISVETEVVKVGSTSITTEQRIYRQDVLLAICVSVVVMVDKDGAKRAVPNGNVIRKFLGENPASFSSEWVQISGTKALDTMENHGAQSNHEFHIQPRFSDEDGLGHVNNTILPLYLFDARMDWFHQKRKEIGKSTEEEKPVPHKAFVYDYFQPMFAGRNYKIALHGDDERLTSVIRDGLSGDICFQAKSCL